MPALPAEKDRAQQLFSVSPPFPVNVKAAECTALPNQLQFVKGRKNCDACLVAYRDERQSDIRAEI